MTCATGPLELLLPQEYASVLSLLSVPLFPGCLRLALGAVLLHATTREG